MMGFEENICPRCHQGKMKTWNELSADEKILAERLPLLAAFTRREREMHLFCPLCRFEQSEQTKQNC